jgi:CubicO group peptidase (beta-lactamase class C family)
MNGHVAPGFEGVAIEFERNFSERGDLGAAFAVCLDGEMVVDLWGGQADPGPPSRPWESDTLQLIFSGTKGLVAACALMLIDRRLLSLDDPVCKYWPEFAAGGKQSVTVAEVFSHQARLPGVREPLQEDDLTDDVRLAELLAAQAQETDPRAAASYHGLTYGWLCGELIRRVDGRSVGRFFADEIARPLDLELWIGLPEAYESRVSTLLYGADWPDSDHSAQDYAADPFLARVEVNPPVLMEGRMPWNTRAFHAAEIPAVNAIGSARSIARLYCCLARGGELDGVRLMSSETIELGRRELSRFVEAFSGEPLAYGTGFELQTQRMEMGPPACAFGHSGAGGSVHGAWPQQRLGFSYAMNEMRPGSLAGDPRSKLLLDRLFEALPADTPVETLPVDRPVETLPVDRPVDTERCRDG